MDTTQLTPAALTPTDAPVLDVHDDDGRVSCEVAWPGEAPALADVMAVFDSLGVRVLDHAGQTTPAAARLDRFVLERPSAPAGRDHTGGHTGDHTGDHTHDRAWSERFVEAFVALVRGDAELDVFNRLVLQTALSWREVALVRAIHAYLRQTGLTDSAAFVQQTWARHEDLLASLVELVRVRFAPEPPATDESALRQRLQHGLDAVEVLDEDRVLRRYLEFVDAVTRTNFFRRDTSGPEASYFSFKLDAPALSFLPEPRPLIETFVYSPEVEGLHLRAGRVARGGIRWSDRRDDYRAEVLGLMRAQAVKNAVIVPDGAKGAFVVKTSLAGKDAAERAEVVRRAYRTFIRGLLDLADNIVAGETVPPAGVRRRDGDDTYLVVAADKGTATFSDIANEIARARGYWLGDAFASGGSAGYDHKRMGITARGAWESVLEHLRQLGLDPSADSITVVGIGDMSGDVFGNGMLLSRRLKLVAAFDHRHIFLDPDPDPEASFAERQRLFDLPGSTWSDYDRGLLSPGGGVWSRDARSIPISPQVRERLGLDADVAEIGSSELIQAILRAPVDLLWNGGVGTYVKASTETSAQAADKANDVVRVDATQLRAAVVGEGGNLGLTQRARIEYAARGGLVNADFIDNSAGVDTSDHEVNLKILLRGTPADVRDKLLADAEEEVAAAVLENNRRQATAISLAAAQSADVLDQHVRLIELLERADGLDRRLEQLPDAAEIAERRARGLGLTRPEIALLMARSKNVIRDLLLESALPDDPALAELVRGYFPASLRGSDTLALHPLRREIAATVLANDLLNYAGPGLLLRLEEDAGVDVAEAAAAFLATRRLLGIDELWAAVLATAGAAAQARYAVLAELQDVLGEVSAWLLRATGGSVRLEETIAALGPIVAQVVDDPDLVAWSSRLRGASEHVATLERAGAPDLAARLGGLRSVAGVAAVLASRLAPRVDAGVGRPEVDAARLTRMYVALVDALSLHAVVGGRLAGPGEGHGTATAKRLQRAELKATLVSLATELAVGTGAEAEVVASWLVSRPRRAQHWAELADRLPREAPGLDLLVVLLEELRRLQRPEPALAVR